MPADVSRRIWPILVFVLSSIFSLLVGNVMMASHTPFKANPNGLAYLAHDVATAKGTWQAIHLLSTTCSCSRGVAEHLIARRPMANLQEAVVLAGKDDALSRRLKLAGFPVRNIEPETVVGQYHVDGAPWLVFVSPAGDVRYLGGYTPAHARNNYQDQQVWADLANGRPVESLPVLGCALGKRLQRSIDPLGIKYSN